MKKRIDKIYEIMELEVKVDIEDLAKRFNVSRITIRRDLKELEKRGVATCLLRGATINRESTFRIPYAERIKKNIHEKRAIARKALSYIKPEDTIVICSGTTTYQLAKLLRNNKMKIRVFTNALDSAMELSYSDNTTTIIAGGKVTETYTLETQEDKNIDSRMGIIDKMFIGGDGVDLKHGLTAFREAEIEANYIMMNNNAREIIILLDHSKFNVVRYTKLLPLERISVLISDNRLSEITAQEYKEKGVNLVLAKTSENS